MANSKGCVENLKPFKKGLSGNPTGQRKLRSPEQVIERSFHKAERIIIEDLREAAKRLTDKALKALEECSTTKSVRSQRKFLRLKRLSIAAGASRRSR
jgi:hypothetical protein